MINLFKDAEITDEEFLRKYDNNEVIFPKDEYYQMPKCFKKLPEDFLGFDCSDFEINKNIKFFPIVPVKDRYFVIFFTANYCSNIVTCNHISILEVEIDKYV